MSRSMPIIIAVCIAIGCGGASDSTGPKHPTPAVGQYELRTTIPEGGFIQDQQEVDTLVLTYSVPDSIAGYMQPNFYLPAMDLGFWQGNGYLIYIHLRSGNRTVGVLVNADPLVCDAQFVPSTTHFACSLQYLGQ